MIRYLPRYSNSDVRSAGTRGERLRHVCIGAGLVVSLSIGLAAPFARADELDDQYQQLQDQVSASTKQVDDQQRVFDQTNGVLANSQKELAEAQAVLARAQSQEAAAKEAANQTASKLQQATQDLQAAQAGVDSAQADVDTQQTRVAVAAQQEIQQSKTLSAVGLLFSQKGSGDLQNQAQWARNAASSIQSQMDALNDALARLQTRRDDMASAEQQAQQAKDVAVAQFEQAQKSSSEAVKAADDVQSKVAANQAALHQAQEALSDQLASDADLRQRAEALAGRIKARDDAAAAAAAAAAGASAAGVIDAQSSWVTANTAPGQIAPPYSVAQAIEHAKSMVGNMNYGNMCLALVANFYGYSSSGVNSATDAANVVMNAGQMHYDTSSIPVGALVFYNGAPVGNPFGHIAMYAGDGMIYSNGAANGGVGLISLTTPSQGWGEPLIGWSSVWLPYATA